MRRARVVYDGSYHHVMNRGLEGRSIFLGDKSKSFFLNLLKEKSKKLKIRLLGYCVMDNHYHLILQNSSAKLSEFMKQLNGHYGMIYRKKEGEKGYVFQDFKIFKIFKIFGDGALICDIRIDMELYFCIIFYAKS